jgi:hypothetical protein
METIANPKIGRFHRGLELTKSSWRVLSLDKQLAIFPALSILSCAVAIVAITAGSLTIFAAIYSDNYSSNSPLPIIIVGAVIYIYPS